MSNPKTRKQIRPSFWIPSLYFAEGIPYVVVMTASVIMYKRLGISNTEIALYTSWLYLPWVIKPIWSPIVDVLKTKRYWIVTMQLLIGAGLAGVAFTIPADNFLRLTLAFFWLLAFSSATHDIAADGFYMLGLNDHEQAWWVGIRSTFYRLAMITGQGLLVMLAGYIESSTGLPTETIVVEAVERSATSEQLLRDQPGVAPQEGVIEITAFPSTVSVSLERQPAYVVDSLVAAAVSWNRERGFYHSDSSPGSITNLDGTVGNVGIAYFRLSGDIPTGERYIVNLGRSSGDQSIKLIEGDRFEFNETNAGEAVMVVFQLDPKLSTGATASFEAKSGNIPFAWSITFYALAGLFVILFAYHRFILPRPANDVAVSHESVGDVFAGFGETFASFFQKKQILVILGFLVLFRFAEAQLVKLASPFLLDGFDKGGLGLTTGEVGFVYGTVGVLMLTFGGILGGFLAARDGLKRWLWWMVLAINLPNIAYVFLSWVRPESFWVVNAAVGLEQFGYGFGFTAYMLYMIYIAQGKHQTAHFAICTGFMALGMMLPGMFSGWLQEIIGYQNFFVWVVLSTIPSFLIVLLIPLDKQFGKRKEVG